MTPSTRPIRVTYTSGSPDASAPGRRRPEARVRQRVQGDPGGRDDEDLTGVAPSERLCGTDPRGRGSHHRRSARHRWAHGRQRTRSRTAARVPLPVGGVQWANHTNPSGSTVRPASSFASRAAALWAASRTASGSSAFVPSGSPRGRCARQGTPTRHRRKRAPGVAAEHQGLDAVGRRGGARRSPRVRRGRARRRHSSVDSHRARQYRPSPARCVVLAARPWLECVASRPRGRFGAPSRRPVCRSRP